MVTELCDFVQTKCIRPERNLKLQPQKRTSAYVIFVLVIQETLLIFC